MTTVQIEVTEGRAEVVKRASTTADRARLAQEAALLGAARHPGVVELVGHRDDGANAELRLRWAGPRTLALAGPLPGTQAAALVAAVGDIVGDLHERGIVHGRLTPDHVITASGGRPVLCGLAAADDARRRSPADDVAALGGLLIELLGSEPDGEPIPSRRPRLWGRRWSGYQRGTLLTLADQACADDPSARPSARAFVEALRTAVPGAHHLPSLDRPGPAPLPPPSPLVWGADVEPVTGPRTAPPATAGPVSLSKLERPRPRPLSFDALHRWPRHAAWVLAGVVGVALVLVGFRELTGDPARPEVTDAAEPIGPAATSAPRPTTTEPSRTTGVPGTTSTPPPPTTEPPTATTAPPPRPVCPAVALPAADIDGDGCAEPVHLDGDRVMAGDTTYQVGVPGDVVALGDWDCDGQATPALIRPATGQVFVFDGWATPSREVTVDAVDTVAEGTAITPRDTDGDGCPELIVERGTRPPTVVPTPTDR